MIRPLVCYDCGKYLRWDNAWAIRLDSKVYYLCHGCYRSSLPRAMRNQMPKWVCPKCGAVIYTAMPQAMWKCPVCGYKVKERNPLTKLIEYKIYYAGNDIDHIDWRTAKKLVKSPPVNVDAISRVTRWWYEDGQLEREEEKFLFERNPIRKVKGGWQWGYHGKVYPTRTQALKQMRAIFASGYKGRNPRKQTWEEKAGGVLGGMGILAIPIITGLILWIKEKYGK